MNSSPLPPVLPPYEKNFISEYKHCGFTCKIYVSINNRTAIRKNKEFPHSIILACKADSFFHISLATNTEKLIEKIEECLKEFRQWAEERTETAKEYFLLSKLEYLKFEEIE